MARLPQIPTSGDESRFRVQLVFWIQVVFLMLVDQPCPDRPIKRANVVKNFVTVVSG